MYWRSRCWPDSPSQDNYVIFEEIQPGLPASFLLQNQWPQLLQISQKDIPGHLTKPLLNSLLKSHLECGAKKWTWWFRCIWAAGRRAGLLRPHQNAELLLMQPGITLANWQAQNIIASYRPLKLLWPFFISCCKHFSPHPVLIDLFIWTQFQGLTFISFVLRIHNSKWTTP